MKNVILMLVLAFSITAVAQQKIGEEQNGNYVITENIDALKRSWAEILVEQGISSKLHNWKIVQLLDAGQPYFILLATTSDNMASIATGLNFVGKNAYLAEPAGVF